MDMAENNLAYLAYISSGKAKDIYETPDGDLLFEFTDRVTAFDGKKKAQYQEKGEITCRVAEYWFKSLDKDVFRKGTGDLTAAYGELFERMQKS